jgi:hypothetical protein
MTNVRRQRRALSLLEVILAIAILGGALAVLGELMRLGARSAAQARDLTTAQLFCESKLNELTAGIEEPVATSSQPLDESGEWLYTVEPETIDEQGLISIRVTVTQSPEAAARPVLFSLTRWIVDPAVELAAEEEAALLKQQAADAAAAAQESSAPDAGTANPDAGSGQGTGGGAGGGTGGGTGGGNNGPPSGGARGP